MIKTALMGMALVPFLGACSMLNGMGTGGMGPLTFKHNATPADPMATGVATRSMSSGMLTTTLNLSGLTPNKAYASHYHAFGLASDTDSCASNGPITLGFPAFSSDADGKATVSVTSDPAKIAGDQGAYINVHYADDLGTVPICAPVKMPKTKM
ncbi:MAG: CHRD domain-containing protein [Deinococcus sp.]